jgi:hypothetical protein
MSSRTPLALRSGDVVAVRNKEEILATLDASGELDGLPFMPEMLAFCGTERLVYKRADKTCDTIDNAGSFRMHDTVHLTMLRCDGSAHGGCQAGCLLFFKEDWLRPVADSEGRPAQPAALPAAPAAPALRGGATEADLQRACTQPGSPVDGKIRYRCQATQLKAASEPLMWWDVRQYVRDLVTGNAPVGQMIRGFALAAYRMFMGLGRGHRAKIAFFNWWQSMHGGIPFPWRQGSAEKTPTVDLGLKPGDWVRVKPYDDIVATLDKNNKTRGLWFDQEMVKYCGGTYRVERKVERIIHEKHHDMLEFKTQPVILQDVFCCGDLSNLRLFCPRAIHIYWRDIWLERVDPPAAAARLERIG